MQNCKNVILETPKIIDTNFSRMISNKVYYLQEVIKKTIIATQKYKTMDIFGANELNICILNLETIFSSLSDIITTISNNKFDSEQVINNLQNMTNELSNLFKNYGTENIDDLIQICFGKDYIDNNLLQDKFKEKYNVMKKYLHPICYKSIPWKCDPFR